MNNILFEKENKPKGSFPFISFEMKNLSRISHYHEEIEIAFVEKGDITATCGSNPINLSKGNICIFMPGEIHSFITAEENNCFIIKINTNSYVEQIDFSKIRLKSNKITNEHLAYPLMSEIITNIHNEYSNKDTAYEFAIRSYKNTLITIILRNLEYKEIESNKNLNILNTINNYIENHFSDKINLDDVASHCHISKFYFSHIFKEMTGMSFISYLSLFRIEKAKVFLQYSDKSITDISLECGFGNVRSFNRMFKGMLNTTPLNYRKKIK